MPKRNIAEADVESVVAPPCIGNLGTTRRFVGRLPDGRTIAVILRPNEDHVITLYNL